MLSAEFFAGVVDAEVYRGLQGSSGTGSPEFLSAIVTWIVGPRATLYRAPAIPDPNAHPRGDAEERPEGHPAADLRHEGCLHLARLPHRLAQRGSRHDGPHPLALAGVGQAVQ